VLTIQGGSGYERNLLPFFNETSGTLEISHIGGQEVIIGTEFDRKTTNAFWSEVLRLIAYRLIPGNGPPNACVFYQMTKTTKIFTLQAFDVQGRASNIISRRFRLLTAAFIYTDAFPVIVNDANGLKSVSIERPSSLKVRFNESTEL
jgi:hypothetical protein